MKKKQDGYLGLFSTFSKEFCCPSRAKGIAGRDFKYVGYVHHYIIVSRDIFDVIVKQKGHHRRFFVSHEAVYRDFPVIPLGQNVLYTESSNLKDMFIATKVCLQNTFGLILKNKMATTGVYLTIIHEFYTL